MNKKEISEIKKQFTPNNCAITRICGCYADGEKNKKTNSMINIYENTLQLKRNRTIIKYIKKSEINQT